jgi:hypothetical protein
LAATFLAIFFVPLFFVAMLRLFRVTPRRKHEPVVAARRGPAEDFPWHATANGRPALPEEN